MSTTTSSQYFIGLMSGTSVDGIDAALVAHQPKTSFTLQHCYNHPLSNQTKQRITELTQPGNNEIDKLGVLDRELGHEFAKAVNQLLRQSGLKAEQIAAIGSHGQTLRHRISTNKDSNFSLQIGDPNTIAEHTGITTVADFRRRDVAAGGQGAPLAPAFHQALFGQQQPCITVNIGGIANLSILPSATHATPPTGYDCGPGNLLLDAWCQRHQQQPYDDNGAWARSGDINSNLLEQLRQHHFLELPPPKSTGREDFHSVWLDQQLEQFPQSVSPVNVQATLVEFTATTIASAIQQHRSHSRCSVYVCGGGAHNRYLMDRLQHHLNGYHVTTTAALDIDPDWVEAIGFAWLAQQTLSGLPGNIPNVTGAKGERILGGIYPA